MTWMDYKHTCDTIYTHFWGYGYNIYGFGGPFYAPSFSYPSTTHPACSQQVYPVIGSLHKAMICGQ